MKQSLTQAFLGIIAAVLVLSYWPALIPYIYSPDDYYQVRQIVVDDMPEGSDGRVWYDRNIPNGAWHGSWKAIIYHVNGDLVPVCSGEGTSTYSPETSKSVYVTLDWYAGADSCIESKLKAGNRYKMRTVWQTPAGAIERWSNEWTILPAGAADGSLHLP